MSLAGSVYGLVFVLSLVTSWSFYTWARVIWKLRRPELAARVFITLPSV